MHPSEEASALLFPAMEPFESAASVRHGFRGSEVHVPPPPPSLLHTGLLSSQSHTVPQGTQFCNTTQQQYSLNSLAVYFLKRVKSST